VPVGPDPYEVQSVKINQPHEWAILAPHFAEKVADLKKEVITDIEREISREIKNSKQIVLSGTDGTGKTTLLKKIQKRSTDVCVYLNVQLCGDWKKKLFAKVLDAYGYGDLIGLSVRNLDIELAKINSNILQEKIKLLLTEKYSPKDLFSFADIISAETGKRCVLLLDDADGIDISGLKENKHSASVVTRLYNGDIVLEEVKLYDSLRESEHYDLFLEKLFTEKLKRLSPKEKQILFVMIDDVHTPAEVSRIINYPQTSCRRFMAIMEEKGFLELKKRGYFEIMDKELKKWLKEVRA